MGLKFVKNSSHFKVFSLVEENMIDSGVFFRKKSIIFKLFEPIELEQHTNASCFKIESNVSTEFCVWELANFVNIIFVKRAECKAQKQVKLNFYLEQ